MCLNYRLGRKRIPDISSMSTCVAPSCVVIVARSWSGVMPVLAWFVDASASVLALIANKYSGTTSICGYIAQLERVSSLSENGI